MCQYKDPRNEKGTGSDWDTLAYYFGNVNLSVKM
jgi:hypothetical protein